MDIQIGRVTHYYDKVGVAIVEVRAQPLHVGDRIRISGPQSEYIMDISWLQMEYKQVQSVDVGDICAIKVGVKIYEGDMIYLLTRK